MVQKYPFQRSGFVAHLQGQEAGNQDSVSQQTQLPTQMPQMPTQFVTQVLQSLMPPPTQHRVHPLQSVLTALPPQGLPLLPAQAQNHNTLQQLLQGQQILQGQQFLQGQHLQGQQHFLQGQQQHFLQGQQGQLWQQLLQGQQQQQLLQGQQGQSQCLIA